MEQEIEIRNRSLDTLKKLHVTIINRLPQNAGDSTRIDISDRTKVNNKNDYKPDDSTKTIWTNQGIRFSPHFNKTGEPEHKRLGMNDAGDAALVALYIHGIKNSLIHLVIGTDSRIKFGDTVTITTESHKPNQIFINVESPSKELEGCLHYHTCGYGNGFFIDNNPKETNNARPVQKAELIGPLTHPDILECSDEYETYLTEALYIKAIVDEHNKEEL